MPKPDIPAVLIVLTLKVVQMQAWTFAGSKNKTQNPESPVEAGLTSSQSNRVFYVNNMYYVAYCQSTYFLNIENWGKHTFLINQYLRYSLQN